MSGKLRKNAGLFLVPFSFLFLVEPSVALLDPLPDFVGYALLCFAIINLADINSAVMDAFIKFRLAALLSIARLIAFLVVEFAFENRDSTVISLLFVFVFALADIVVLLPAYKRLFEGLMQLGTYHDGEAVYLKSKANGSNASEKLYVFTAIFVLIKNVAWALPEFTALAENETYEFINVLRLFGAIISVPVGLIWLFVVLVYFIRVNKDTTFIDNLKTAYLEKIEGKESFFVGRTLSVGLITLTVAFVISLNLRLDNVEVIPGVMKYFAVIIAAIILRHYSSKIIALVAFSSLGAIISVFAGLSSDYFFERYLATSVIKDIHAYNAYYFMLLVNAAEQIVFLTVAVLSLLTLKDLYVNNTALSRDIGKKEKAKMMRSFTLGAALTFVFCFLSCCGEMFYYASLPYVEKAQIFSMASVINTLLGILSIFTAWYFISYVRSAVKQSCKQYL